MSATIHEHVGLPAAHTADDRAANSVQVPARVGIRSPWVRYWPAAIGGCAVLAAMLGMLLVHRSPVGQAVQNGRRFTSVERRSAAESLQAAGIASSATDDGRLLVRPGDLTASNAALKQSDAAAALPAPASSWFDTFASSGRQRASAGTAQAIQLGRLLSELPGVEEAEVVWDEEPRVSRRQSPRVRATVFLKPDPGSVIGIDTVQAVRAAVAGSRAYLSAQDVAVMDLDRRVTYGAQSDPAAYAAEVRRAELLAICRSRIEAALADSPGARVALELEERPAREVPAHDEATSVVDQPAPSATRTRIAGVSGPNLRLEVPPETPRRLELDGRAVKALPAPWPQLIVSVALAGEESNGRQGNVSSTSDVESRIVAAVQDLPVTLSRARLTVAALTADTPAGVPVAEVGRASAPDSAWLILKRVSSMPTVQIAAAGLLSVLLLTVFVRRIRGWRRRSSRSSSVGRSRLVAKGSGSANEFLPGVETAEWAPLLAQEPVASVAGLLRHLSADEVAHVLGDMSPAEQSAVLELAPSVELSDSQLDDARRRIRAALATVKAEGARRPSAAPAVVRRRVEPQTPAAVFDDLARIDDASLQTLAARVHAATWSAALMGASPKLQRRMSNVRVLAGDSAETGDRRPMRLREIESAQQSILEAWQALQVVR